MLPQPEPRAVRQFLIVPSIRSERSLGLSGLMSGFQRSPQGARFRQSCVQRPFGLNIQQERGNRQTEPHCPVKRVVRG